MNVNEEFVITLFDEGLGYALLNYGDTSELTDKTLASLSEQATLALEVLEGYIESKYSHVRP